MGSIKIYQRHTEEALRTGEDVVAIAKRELLKDIEVEAPEIVEKELKEVDKETKELKIKNKRTK